MEQSQHHAEEKPTFVSTLQEPSDEEDSDEEPDDGHQRFMNLLYDGRNHDEENVSSDEDEEEESIEIDVEKEEEPQEEQQEEQQTLSPQSLDSPSPPSSPPSILTSLSQKISLLTTLAHQHATALTARQTAEAAMQRAHIQRLHEDRILENKHASRLALDQRLQGQHEMRMAQERAMRDSCDERMERYERARERRVKEVEMELRGLRGEVVKEDVREGKRMKVVKDTEGVQKDGGVKEKEILKEVESGVADGGGGTGRESGDVLSRFAVARGKK